VLDDYVLYNLVRAAATYTEEMSNALKDYGLDTMKWRILMLLDDKSPSSVSALARRSVTKMPTLTRMLTRMEDEGLVRRRVLSEDRRIVEITMTVKAVNTLRTVKSIGQRVFERAIDGIDPRDMETVTKALKQLRLNLNRTPYETAENRASVEQAR